MNEPERRPRKSGFTLIELLVVVAIIAIITGILFPVLARAKLRAKVARVHVELQQVGAAIQMYSDNWDNTPPPANESCDSVEVANYYELPKALYEYISTHRFYDPFNNRKDSSDTIVRRTYKYIAPGPGYVNNSRSKIKLYVPEHYPVNPGKMVARRTQEDSPIKWVVWSVGPSGGCDLIEFFDSPLHRYPVSKEIWYPHFDHGIIVRLSDGRKSP